jgi:hypothetical protein
MKKVKAVNGDFPLEKCEEYQQFVKRVDIESVSVIFSSYYINKPASAFGHTLFKIKNKRSKGDGQLLDYGVDFSAQITTSNPILYGIFGIIGGFNGRFNVMPYFLKLREYNDYEARDLWEFGLNFNAEQKKLFVAHLWDMDKAHFDYFYFSENCSYHVHRFIDAIAPEWDIMQEVSGFVAPMDTITPFLNNPKHLTTINYRPSVFQRLKDSYAQLTEPEQEVFHQVVKKRDFSNLEQSSSQKEILDVVATYLDYKYPKQILLSKGDSVKDIRSFKMKILSKRSKIKSVSRSEAIKKNIKPVSGHKSQRFKVGYARASGDNNIINMELRFALHSIDDYPTWYNPYSTLEMGNVELHYLTDQSRIELKEAQFANVIALRPVDSLFQDISWNMTIGGTSIKELPKNKFSPQIDVGVGYAKKFKQSIFSLFAQTQQRYTSEYLDGNYRLDLGLRAIMKLHHKRWAFTSDYLYARVMTRQHNLTRVLKSSLNYAFTNNFATSLTYQNTNLVKRGFLNFHFYHQ